MGRLLGAVLLAGIMIMMGSALAQNPMSPIYPTTPRKQRPAPSAAKEAILAPNDETSKPPLAQASPVEEGPVATAVIPPPDVQPPTTSAEPKKPVTAGRKPEVAPEPRQAIKHHKRTARRTRYARRYYVPYPVGWYYDAGSGTRGWGGGQFGPSPYSSQGQ